MALSTKLPFSLLQTQWAAEINPILANPIVKSNIITATLIDGTMVIPHKLGRQMQGWTIVDQNAAASIYRPTTAPFNKLTLTLTSNAAVTVNILVF